jgi:VWFA-related protein
MRFSPLVILASLAAAQVPPPTVSDANRDQPIIETFKFVLAPVTVTDHNGNFVPGLTVYDFRLSDNGKNQRITEDVTSHPISMVVVIQANSDVEKILPQIQKLASVFETLVLGEDDEMAVLAFDHKLKTLTGFTSDAAQIDQAFKKLTAGSYTAALNDATMQGINLLRNRPTTRRRILVQIAENRDKGSGMSVREVLTAADFAEVYIYSIDISQLVAALTSKAQPNRPSTLPPGAEHLPMGQTNTATTESQTNMGNWVPALKDVFDMVKGVFVPDPLDVYTRYTGGRQYSFKSQKALERDVAQLGNELHSQYLLTYAPSNLDEPGFHHIIVNVLKPGLSVRTRDGYWWAAAKPDKPKK